MANVKQNEIWITNNGVAGVIKSRQVKTCVSGSGHDQNWFMIEDHHAPPLSSPLTLIKSMLIWDFCIISYQGCCISGPLIGQDNFEKESWQS